MPVQFFTSNFGSFNIGTSTATGTVTFAQNGQTSIRFLLQVSETGTGGWTTVGNPVAGPGGGQDGFAQTVTFTGVNGVNLVNNDGFFRIVGQQVSNQGVPGTQFSQFANSSGLTPTCFLAGTHIATPAGPVAVEALANGDMVLTADGRSVPVLWVGRQTVSTVFGPVDADLPVCISAGALGDNLPLRDLRVTGGHALMIDGVLIHASALVNGTSITRVSRAELGETFTVYHIETELHEIVLAEAAPSETFVDNVTRARFDNFGEYVAMFGIEGRPVAERSEPRALSPRQVPPAVRAMIAARAVVLAGETAVAA